MSVSMSIISSWGDCRLPYRHQRRGGQQIKGGYEDWACTWDFQVSVDFSVLSFVCKLQFHDYYNLQFLKPMTVALIYSVTARRACYLVRNILQFRGTSRRNMTVECHFATEGQQLPFSRLVITPPLLSTSSPKREKLQAVPNELISMAI
jgi:hypothetical protein